MIRILIKALFFGLFLFNQIIYASFSKNTEIRCNAYKKAIHDMLESVNELDRGSRFYSSVSQINKIKKLLSKTEEDLKKFEREAKELDLYLKLRAYTVKEEGLKPLVRMRRDMKYGIGLRYRTKLSKYLKAFRSLLIFSGDNISKIKKGNSQLRRMYDRYYLNYRKEYNLFKKVSKSYRKFIKRYYEKYRVLEKVVPMPDSLFDDSIWNLNKVKFLGN